MDWNWMVVVDTYAVILLQSVDLKPGIEASDVSNLLEQFLEYEEKQGKIILFGQL